MKPSDYGMKSLCETFETERLILRQITMSDAKEMFEALMSSYEYLAPWLGWMHPDMTVAEREWFCQDSYNAFLEGREAVYGLWAKASAKLIGTMKVSSIDWGIPSAEIGYWGSHIVQGKGYMSEAARGVCCYLFEQLDFERIWLTCDIRNSASQRVAERIGMQREAVLRQSERDRNGALTDQCYYSMIRSDR